MSSTPTPHQKFTHSTSPHFPLHHPTTKIPLFWFETDFVPTLHYTHQTLNKINTLPHVLYQFKNLKNIRTLPITNIKTSKTHSNLTPSTNFPELPFKIRTPTLNIKPFSTHQNYNKYNSFYISSTPFLPHKIEWYRITQNHIMCQSSFWHLNPGVIYTTIYVKSIHQIYTLILTIIKTTKFQI